MGSFFSKSISESSERASMAEKPLKVALYDGFSMKKAIDDTMLKLVSTVPDLPENTAWSNIKLSIMAISCVAACVAQFYPLPFPANRLLLAVCVVAYFFLSGVLQFITTFVDKDAVFYGTAYEGRPACVIRTRMGKYDSELALIGECPPGTQVSKSVTSVGRYFTSEGEMVEESLWKELDNAILPGIRAVGAKKKH